MSTKKQEQEWDSDLNPESVENASEIPPTFPMPALGEEMVFVVDGEPYVIETPQSKYNKTAVKLAVKTGEGNIPGEIFLGKSLKFNYKTQLRRNGITPKEAIGMHLRVRHIEGEDGNEYYNCLLYSAE